MGHKFLNNFCNNLKKSKFYNYTELNLLIYMYVTLDELMNITNKLISPNTSFYFHNKISQNCHLSYAMNKSSAENQKGTIADQRCSVENQKGAIAIIQQ